MLIILVQMYLSQAPNFHLFNENLFFIMFIHTATRKILKKIFYILVFCISFALRNNLLRLRFSHRSSWADTSQQECRKIYNKIVRGDASNVGELDLTYRQYKNDLVF